MINSISFLNYIYSDKKALPQSKTNAKGIPSAFLLKDDVFVKSTSSNPIKKANFSSSVSFGSALSAETVLDKMNSQLMDVSVEDIDGIIEGFPSEDKDLVLDILKRATQFGNIESMNSIYDSVIDEKSKGYGCFSFTDPRANSLIETFSYLAAKKAFSRDPADFVDQDFIGYRKKGAFLLDKTILSKLQTNRDLLVQTTRNDYKLIYPEGWDSGITAFNLTTVDDIRKRTKKLYNLTKKLQEKNGLSKEDALSEALIYDTKKALKNIGLDKKLTVIKNNNIDFSKKPTSEDIASQLSSRKFDLNGFENMIKSQRGSRDVALEILQKDARIMSMRELGLIAKKTHTQIVELAESKNVKEDEIFYLLPLINKSYNLIALQYQQVNNIPESQFVLDRDMLKNNTKAKMVVVLDDYVGSGDSLKNARYFLRQLYKGELVLAPCVSTKTGAKFIDLVSKEDDKCTFMPGSIINSYFDSPEFLSKDNKYSYYDVIGKAGWGKVQANIVFPYMAPDNNTSFFADNIASNYTFNSAGIKKSDEGDSYYFCEPD